MRRSGMEQRRILLAACLVGVVAVASALVAFPADAVSRSVLWDASAPLTWAQFQAAPPADAARRADAAAIHMTLRWHATYSMVSRGSGWSGSVDSVTVTNAMDPSLSWVVPGKATGAVLRHEQGHFDLNEVYRRKLELLLPCLRAEDATQAGLTAKLGELIRQEAGKVLARVEEIHALYDVDTRHGNEGEAQALWQSKIASWLDRPLTAP